MRKFFLSFTFFCCVTFPVVAQNGIGFSGYLYSADSNPAAGVAVLLTHIDDDKKIIGYTFSDENGYFEIIRLDAYSKARVSLRSLEYRDTAFVINLPCMNLQMNLKPKVNQIKEVSVTRKSIEEKGDTISYLVSSFSRPIDYSISDVIEKLPGFSVDEEGRVYYQGKKIRKYYVEGMDLMDGNYALVNKNLPHKNVSTVEVIKNHQSIKALENIIHSNELALNIRLKDRVALTGTVNGALGADPLLTKINASPMLFAKDKQVVASWQGNNIGEILKSQHNTVSVANGELKGANTLQEVFVSPPNSNTLRIRNVTAYNNLSGIFSYNQLNKIKNDLELKMKFSWLNEKVESRKLTLNTYFLFDSILSIHENLSNEILNSSILTSISVSKNTKKVFLNESLEYGGYWDHSKSGISTSNSENIVKAYPFHQTLSNNFELLYPLGKGMLNVKTIIDYNYSPQQLKLLVAGDIANGFGADVVQYVRNTSLNASSQFTFIIPFRNKVISTNATIKHNILKHKTFIVSDGVRQDADSLENNLDWSFTELSTNNKLTFNINNRFRMNLNYPLEYAIASSSNPPHFEKIKRMQFVINPSLLIDYKLSESVSLSSKFGINHRLSMPNDLLVGYTLSGYRHFIKGGPRIEKEKSFSSIFNVDYQLPAHGINGNINWLYSIELNNRTLNQIVGSYGLVLTNTLPIENVIKSNMLSSYFSYYIFPFKTTLKLNSSLALQKIPSFLGNEKTINNIRTLKLDPSILINSSMKWRAELSTTTGITFLDFNKSSTRITENNYGAKFFYSINNMNILGLESNYYVIQTKNHNPNSSFIANIFYQYKIDKKRITIEFKVRNIFNFKQFVQIYKAENAIQKTIYFINPRFFILSLNWAMGKN